MSIKDIIKARLNLTESADDNFLDEIAKTEKSLYSAIIKLLRGYTKGSKLNKDLTDLQLYKQLQIEIDKAISKSTYKSKVEGYLPNFDKVDELNIMLFDKMIGKNISKLITVEKRQVIEDVTDFLLSPQSIRQNIRRPIQKIMYRNIVFGSDIKTAEDELRKFITGNEKTGHLTRYVKQISNDAISQYNGEINQKVAEAYDMEGFMYIGSIMKNSRQNCVDFVYGSGPFEPYAVSPGKYKVEDIPELIRIAETRPGWIQGTNPSNFFRNRGGWNCRHEVIPVTLEDDIRI